MTGHVERLTLWRDCRGDPYPADSTDFTRDVIALLAEREAAHAAAAGIEAALAVMPTAPPPSTIPVRVRVLVRAGGKYAAYGWTDAPDKEVQDVLWTMMDNEAPGDEVTHTLTAHLPLPQSVQIPCRHARRKATPCLTASPTANSPNSSPSPARAA